MTFIYILRDARHRVSTGIILFLFVMSAGMVAAQSPCDSFIVSHNPNKLVIWSPDSSKYLINIQDTAGVYQIYVGVAGDTVPVSISTAYTNGNCCGLFRSWDKRNKMQVQWH